MKCRLSGLRPSAVVIVATVRALKYHGGVPKAELGREELSSLIQDQGQADLTCQFCDKIYHYSKEQLEELLAEM